MNEINTTMEDKVKLIEEKEKVITYFRLKRIFTDYKGVCVRAGLCLKYYKG